MAAVNTGVSLAIAPISFVVFLFAAVFGTVYLHLYPLPLNIIKQKKNRIPDAKVNSPQEVQASLPKSPAALSSLDDADLLHELKEQGKKKRRPFYVPILCNAGSKEPAKYVFAALGSAASLCLITTICLEALRLYMSTSLTILQHVLNILVAVIGIAAAISLAIMCVVNVRENAKIHNSSAAAFMAFGILYMAMNLILDEIIFPGVNPPDVTEGALTDSTIWWRLTCAIWTFLSVIMMAVCMHLEAQRLAFQALAPSMPSPPKREDGAKSGSMYDDMDFSNPEEIKKKKDPSDVNIPLTLWALTQYSAIGATLVYFLSFVGPFSYQLTIYYGN